MIAERLSVRQVILQRSHLMADVSHAFGMQLKSTGFPLHLLLHVRKYNVQEKCRKLAKMSFNDNAQLAKHRRELARLRRERQREQQGSETSRKQGRKHQRAARKVESSQQRLVLWH